VSVKSAHPSALAWGLRTRLPGLGCSGFGTRLLGETPKTPEDRAYGCFARRRGQEPDIRVRCTGAPHAFQPRYLVEPGVWDEVETWQSPLFWM